MKALQIITLIGLIGITSFISTHLHAHTYTNGEIAHPWTESEVFEQYGGEDQILTFVYGRVVVWTGYEYPKAQSVHSAYVNNYSGGLAEWPNPINDVRFYVEFTSLITGPNDFEDYSSWDDGGWLDSYWDNNADDPSYWWVDYHHLKEFNLISEDDGDYTLTANSRLTASRNIDEDENDEKDEWQIGDKLEFEVEHLPLGIE